MHQNPHNNDALFLQLPQLESPKIPPSYGSINNNSMYNNNNNYDQVTDWRVLDKFVASQLSTQQDGYNGACSSSTASEKMNMQLQSDTKGQEMSSEIASLSASSSQFDNIWK